MLDERTDLLIQISLAGDAPQADRAKIENLRRHLAQLESEISTRFKNSYV